MRDRACGARSAPRERVLPHGCCGAAEFNGPYYLGLYGDLRAAFGATNYAAARNPRLGAGINEGRRSAADFDLKAYLARYPELRATYGDTNYAAALFHWQTAAINEGRNPAP